MVAKKTRLTKKSSQPLQRLPDTERRQTKFIEAYFKKLGHIGQACKTAGISRETYYIWLARDAEFKKRLREKIEHIDDTIEQVMTAKAIKGDKDLLKFIAKTKLKHRGYVERQENLNLNVEVPPQIVFGVNTNEYENVIDIEGKEK